MIDVDDWVRYWHQRRARRTVLVHRGFWLSGPLASPHPYLFVKITNLDEYPVTISHVWFDGSDHEGEPTPDAHILDPELLPATIGMSQTHEVWIRVTEVVRWGWMGRQGVTDAGQAAYACRVRFTDGRVVKGRQNWRVPDLGLPATLPPQDALG